MICEKCGAEGAEDAYVCDACGMPLRQNLEGFEHTAEIQSLLRQIVSDYAQGQTLSVFRLAALMNDFLQEYENERRLLVNMLRAGILRSMVEADSREIGVLRAKSAMLRDCYITNEAAEFVLLCFTYLLGWPYKPDDTALLAVGPRTDEPVPAEHGAQRSGPVVIDEKVFRPLEASRFRLSHNVVVPEGYTKLESFCFDRFVAMRSIVLPQTLLSIGEYAFSECRHLRALELPKSLKVIEQGAFSQCERLVVLKIPEGVLEIADNTFLCCQSLDVVEVPRSVTSIGASAFSGCLSLHKLFLHDGIKYIGDDAFVQTPHLKISCVENSYIHRYCLSHDVPFEIAAEGSE